MNIVSRRQFLGTAIGAGLAPLAAAPSRDGAAADLAFFVIGDTHYLADRKQPGRLDPVSARTNARLVDVLNRLPGTAIPRAAGGGTVAVPRGVIHAGDVIDTGDKDGAVFAQMQKTEWQGFAADHGLTGRDGRLKFPVYEVHGNHDSPRGDGLAVARIKERNRTRPGVTHVSKNGLHYSWDWGPVHFVNLGIVVGEVKDVVRKRRYNPLDSLAFLVDDLAAKVGKSGRPVVVTHHVDVARYAKDPNPKGPATKAEWDPADVRGYHEALKAYNVIAILYGHTHVRNVFQWDGSAKKAARGISVFNVDNSAHFNSNQQAAYYVHLRGGEMTVREFATPDRWETVTWTPQVWARKVVVGGAG